jgi:hypothetical protein
LRTIKNFDEKIEAYVLVLRRIKKKNWDKIIFNKENECVRTIMNDYNLNWWPKEMILTNE